MNIPAVGEVLAAFFSASPESGDPGVCVDSCGRLEAEVSPGATAEPEPELEATL